MKSTLKNMLLVLGSVCAVAGAALGVMNAVTAGPIADAQQKARLEAVAEVLPEFDNDVFADSSSTDDGLKIYRATLGGKPVGTAVETYSNNGFSGRIDIMAGFDTKGRLTGYKVLNHAETPGLGAKMDTWFTTAPHSVIGTVAPLEVKTSGSDAASGASKKADDSAAKKADDAHSGASKVHVHGAEKVDAITGATITSRAFLDALNRARKAAFPD